MFNSSFYYSRILIAGLFIWSAAIATFAQAPPVLWSKIYGENAYDRGRCIQPTNDGGSIVVGQSNALYSGGSTMVGDVWLVKTDSMGDTLWTKTYTSAGLDDGFSVLQTSDGGYLITAATPSNNPAQEWDAWVIKTDNNGDTLWTKTFGGLGEELLVSALETSQGDFIFAGSTSSFGSGEFDAWLFKTDSTGVLIWTKTFGGIFSDYGNAVQQTLDGGFILTGRRLEALPGEPDLWIIRTDANGDSLWTKILNGSSSSNSFDEGRDVQTLSDGGFIVLGFTGFSAWLIRTDANGDTIWTKQHLGDGKSLQETSNDGFIIAGGNRLIRTDENGDTVWTKNIPGLSTSVLQTSDDGFIVAGYQFSSSTKDDFWLLRLDSENPTAVSGSDISPTYFELSQNYPNPFNPSTAISYTLPYAGSIKLEVFNMLGEIVTVLDEGFKQAGTYNVSWDASRFSSGVYIYTLKAGKFVETKKMILLR